MITSETLKIHERQRGATIAESLKAHVHRRMDDPYPDAEFGSEGGALLPGARTAAEASAKESACNRGSRAREESAFDAKQITMPDEARSVADTFSHLRPSIVVDEAESAGTRADEVVSAQVVKNAVDMEVPMSSALQEQFMSPHLASIFAHALNYRCGGADYPELFENWQEFREVDPGHQREHLKPRFRRTDYNAALTPGECSRMLATRPDAQVAGDWMFVPSARQLGWRYKALKSSFMTCKQRVAPGDSLAQNLDEVTRALGEMWERIQAQTAAMKRPKGGVVKMHLNGDVRKLFGAEDIAKRK